MRDGRRLQAKAVEVRGLGSKQGRARLTAIPSPTCKGKDTTMASGIEIKSNEGGYETRVYDFALADDLYLFFRFESPKSKCEIGIAYDQYEDAGDWYVNDGHLGGQDYQIIDDIIFDKLPEQPEWFDFRVAVDKAVRRFNRC